MPDRRLESDADCKQRAKTGFEEFVTIRFLADEDVRADIVHGLRFREPAIDIRDVKSAFLGGIKDPALLDLAAEQNRILISHDRNTFPAFDQPLPWYIEAKADMPYPRSPYVEEADETGSLLRDVTTGTPIPSHHWGREKQHD